MREISPWHWLLHAEPLRSGWAVEAWLLPLAVALALMVLGALLFVRRDLR